MSSATEQDRQRLIEAIELSRRSPRTPTNYAVGALLVDHDGVTLDTGFTGETAARVHAEEAVLAKAAVRPGCDLSRATIYSSLEPCTARTSRPVTCTELILAAGIRRVVIALREPLLFVDCHGVESLRAHGVDVVEIDDLGHRVREINADVLAAGPADAASFSVARREAAFGGDTR